MAKHIKKAKKGHLWIPQKWKWILNYEQKVHWPIMAKIGKKCQNWPFLGHKMITIIWKKFLPSFCHYIVIWRSSAQDQGMKLCQFLVYYLICFCLTCQWFHKVNWVQPNTHLCKCVPVIKCSSRTAKLLTQD